MYVYLVVMLYHKLHFNSKQIIKAETPLSHRQIMLEVKMKLKNSLFTTIWVFQENISLVSL